jgi:hypothetical protein
LVQKPARPVFDQVKFGLSFCQSLRCEAATNLQEISTTFR